MFKEKVEEVPKGYGLSQNYPNPFNPVTEIKFALPEDGYVKLIVYDILGREGARLVDGEVRAGYHTVRWDASNMSSGIYIYRIMVGNKFTGAKGMLLIK